MTAKWGTRDRPWPISVGDLDAWEYYKEAENMTAAAFLARLNRDSEATMPMIIGQCFHESMERLLDAERTSRGKGGVEFDLLLGRSAGYQVTFTSRIPISLVGYDTVEQDVERIIETPSGWVHLRGVIDGLYGNVVRDLKTTKKIAANKYLDSWQWRAYLLAMGEQCTQFEYHVFQLYYSPEQQAMLAERKQVNDIEIVDYMMFRCDRYPEMETDLIGITAELAAYLDLIQWTPPKKRQMEIF